VDVITILKHKRRELESEIGRIDKAIYILNGRGTRKPKRMSAAMRARIGRGVRKAFAQRKASAKAKA
jgi:hypothetical protein